MLTLTPEIERALDWFRWTYETTDYGWRRVELPDAGRGGIAKQEARLMLMLEDIRHHANAALAERLREDTRTREIAEWRTQRRAGRDE